VLHVELKIIVR